MRCLALAQAWQDYGGTVTFVCAELGNALHSRLLSEGMNVQFIHTTAGSLNDVQQVITLARQHNTSMVVVDGYLFTDNYQLQLKQAGLVVLFVDDNGHSSHYYADWILNQNIHAQENLYDNREPYTKLLLGPTYVLLRREFWPWRGRVHNIAPQANHILITMGGSDPDNVTEGILHSITPILTDKGVHVKALVGGSNPHLESLMLFADSVPDQLEILQNVHDMPALMAWADIAISAGGSTLWELALLGVPTCAYIIAENQRSSVETLAQVNAIVILSPDSNTAATISTLRTDQFARAELSAKSQGKVDGYGVERVAMRLLDAPLWLRTANQDDVRLIWAWANEPTTREASFNSAPIPWDNHLSWFSAKLMDRNARIWIGVDALNTPIGQVRFEFAEQSALISVMVTSTEARRGYGSKLIHLGVQRLFNTTPVTVVEAYIKVGNQGSVRAFEKAGFTKRSETVINDFPAYIYTRSK